ncbi:MAG: type I methionyl aminopeptidase [Patescibacteria group bacterium]|jgi:methionyl aminopeptidase
MIIDLKSDEEIEGFKKAGFETGRILNLLIYNAQVGWTGLDLDKIAREECEKIGAKPVFLNYRGFPAAICISKNITLVHGIPNEEPFKHGDLVSIDFGLSLDGFIGDTAKTVIIKSKQHNESFDCYSNLLSDCRFALWKGIQQAIVGNHLSNISCAIETIAKEGKFKVPREYGGHGVSRNNLHSPPFIPNYYERNEENITLRKGMVLAIEPMFIDGQNNKLIVAPDGWSVIAQGNTAHFEHTILITDKEPLVLTDCYGSFLSGKQL